MAEHAQRQPEGGGRLALAGAGVDDQQALLDRLAGDLGILHGLALGHLGAMALGFLLVDRLSCHFTCIGSPATMKQHAVGDRRDALVEPARPRRESAGPAHCRARCPGRPRWRPRTTARAARRARPPAGRIRASRSCSASMWLVSHSVRQSTSTGRPSGTASSAPARSSGASTVSPAFARAAPDAARCARASRRRRPARWRCRSRAAAAPSTSLSACALLPERAPPRRKVRLAASGKAVAQARRPSPRKRGRTSPTTRAEHHPEDQVGHRDRHHELVVQAFRDRRSRGWPAAARRRCAARRSARRRASDKRQRAAEGDQRQPGRGRDAPSPIHQTCRATSRRRAWPAVPAAGRGRAPA